MQRRNLFGPDSSSSSTDDFFYPRNKNPKDKNMRSNKKTKYKNSDDRRSDSFSSTHSRTKKRFNNNNNKSNYVDINHSDSSSEELSIFSTPKTKKDSNNSYYDFTMTPTNKENNSYYDFTMTPTPNSNTTISTKRHSDIYEDELYQFMINNPIKPECRKENIHTLLENFIEEKNLQAGTLAPHTSPIKQSNKKSYHYNEAFNSKLREYSFLQTSAGQQQAEFDNILNTLETSNNRHYGDMMKQAKTFKLVWDLKGRGNREIMLKAYGVKDNNELIQGIHDLNDIAKVMFLYLVDRYPATNEQGQIFIYHCLESHQNNDNEDIYLYFNTLNNELFNRFPIKERCIIIEDKVENFTDDDIERYGFTF